MHPPCMDCVYVYLSLPIFAIACLHSLSCIGFLPPVIEKLGIFSFGRLHRLFCWVHRPTQLYLEINLLQQLHNQWKHRYDCQSYPQAFFQPMFWRIRCFLCKIFFWERLINFQRLLGVDVKNPDFETMKVFQCKSVSVKAGDTLRTKLASQLL